MVSWDAKENAICEKGKQMKNILIVGASGFLGSQLLNRLQKKENIKLFYPSHAELDALNLESVREYLKTNRIEYVFHTAANHAGVGTGVKNELFFLESNLIMNYNLVKASYSCGVKKFITFGTSCCYNDPEKEKFYEDDYWTNKSEIAYGTCKRVMLEQLSLQDKMDWVYLIPPNLYGPGDHFGQKDTHFVPATVKKFDDAIATGSNEITVWGDGSQMRDFLFIEDLVDVLEMTLENDAYDNQLINIATGCDVTVKQIVLLIKKYFGHDEVKINWDISKPTGVGKKSLDNHRFMEISPKFKFTDIENGIRKTIEWHLNGDKY